MPPADLWISLREQLLDIVSGSDRTRTLNPVATPDADFMARDPAAELVDLLHEVLSRGFADHGELVDYAALRASPLYDDFRHCTANLRAFDPAVCLIEMRGWHFGSISTIPLCWIGLLHRESNTASWNDALG